MSDSRLNKSRVGRATKLDGMAAGVAARQLGTRVANTRRSDDEAKDALGRQALEMADRMVKVLGGMKGAAMKVGQTLSMLDPGMVPGPYREEFQAKLAQLQTMAPSVSFKDMRKVIEQDLGEPLSAAEVAERITEELDYELEASNHRALAREYRGHPFIVVPGVITELCRERVIVTEFVEGRKFDEIKGDSAEERSRWGEILFRFYVNGPFRHQLLNGDPHPGNSLFLDDGRVAFIDFGFFKRQTREDVDDQLALLKACYAQDAERLFELTVEQGIIAKRRVDLVGPLMEKYRAGSWWFLEDRDVTLSPKDATKILLEHGGMRKQGFGEIKIPANQVVTSRAFGLLFGILGQLGATNNWYRIGREVIFGEPPVTELGRIEAEYLESRAAPAAR